MPLLRAEDRAEPRFAASNNPKVQATITQAAPTNKGREEKSRPIRNTQKGRRRVESPERASTQEDAGRLCRYSDCICNLPVRLICRGRFVMIGQQNMKRRGDVAGARCNR